MKDVIDQLASEKSQHVEKLIEWLKIPSVSTDSNLRDEVRRAGVWIEEELSAAGFETRLKARFPW